MAGWTAALAGHLAAVDDQQRLTLIRQLERLTCAAAGAQLALARDFDTSQRAEQAASGLPTDRHGRGVAAQLAFARRESPHRGQRDLGLSKVLGSEMPRTLAALRGGFITEWSATIMARETACLSLEDRRAVDDALASDHDRLEKLGPRQLATKASKLAYELDPESVVHRRAAAEADRRVTLRPAPDTMARLSALVPVAQGVAMYAALTKEADSLRVAGDPRSKGQMMSDTLVQRVTGRTTPTALPVRVNLVISDQALLADVEQPGFIDGYGPVPADLVRDLITSPEADAELRRLYARPDTGRLVAMESNSRCFPSALATLIRLRDQQCRTPWCEAPVRHTDHVQGVDEGGATSFVNGQGLCEACNYAKQAPGWRARPSPNGTVTVITPIGMTYTTAPPGPPPPAHPPAPGGSRLEHHLQQLVLAA
ncbi:MAG: DUF222 domain-containing protein [Nocardioidaceae bacterium]